MVFNICICLTCKKEFKIPVSRVKKGEGKYCSRKCYGLYYHGQKRKPRTKEWQENLSRSLKGRKVWIKGKHWSKEMRKKIGESHKGKKLTEEHKRKIGKAGIGRIVTLETRRKRSEANKGPKSHFWKGGTTSLALIIRGNIEYRVWRETGFKRDDYTCQECSQRGGELNFDHYPKSFATIIIENNIQNIEEALSCPALWDINNGRTLCISCHKKTETYLNRWFHY